MSGKSIKTLADQLWKSHGVSLVGGCDEEADEGEGGWNIVWDAGG